MHEVLQENVLSTGSPLTKDTQGIWTLAQDVRQYLKQTGEDAIFILKSRVLFVNRPSLNHLHKLNHHLLNRLDGVNCLANLSLLAQVGKQIEHLTSFGSEGFKFGGFRH